LPTPIGLRLLVVQFCNIPEKLTTTSWNWWRQPSVKLATSSPKPETTHFAVCCARCFCHIGDELMTLQLARVMHL